MTTQEKSKTKPKAKGAKAPKAAKFIETKAEFTEEELVDNWARHNFLALRGLATFKNKSIGRALKWLMEDLVVDHKLKLNPAENELAQHIWFAFIHKMEILKLRMDHLNEKFEQAKELNKK